MVKGVAHVSAPDSHTASQRLSQPVSHAASQTDSHAAQSQPSMPVTKTSHATSQLVDMQAVAQSDSAAAAPSRWHWCCQLVSLER